MAKDIAKVVFWTSLVSALVIVDAVIGCNCTGYHSEGYDYCFDALMDLTWDGTSLIDAVDAGSSSIVPWMMFISKWATCSFMESMTKKIPIIQTCPSNYKGSIENKNRCEAQSNSIPPVDFNGVFAITFRNIFCARCHGINEDLMVHVNSWFGNLKCSGKISSIHDDDTCQVQFDPPFMRLDCDRQPLEDFFRIMDQGCKSNDTEVCLIFNFVRRDVQRIYRSCLGDIDLNTVTTLYRYPTELRRVTINGQKTKESLACREDESFDEYFFTCRQIVCPPSYFPKLGQCRNNLTIYLNADTQPFPIANDFLALNISTNKNKFDVYDRMKNIVRSIQFVYPSQWMKNITSYSNTWRYKSVQIIFNLNETFLEDFVKTLSDILMIEDEDVFNEFRVNYHVLQNNISCPKESYALRCTDKAEIKFQKDTIFARLMSNNQSFLVALENTYFEIKITYPISTMEILSVCLCEPLPLKFDVTSSAKLYKLTANEYTLLIVYSFAVNLLKHYGWNT